MSGDRHKLLARQLKSVQSVLDRLSPEDRQPMDRFIAAVDDAYRTYDDDREFLEHTMELSSAELFNANKEMQAHNVQLKELQMAAEKLRHENALILDSVREGIVRLDLDGRITFANPRAIEMVGRAGESFVGRTVHEVLGHIAFGGRPCAGTKCGLSAFTDGSNRHSDTESFVRKDGTEFPAEYTAAPIREGEKVVGAVIVFKDISTRKKLEREYLDAAHHAGMSEIAIGVLHNVGNILNSVSVGAEEVLRISQSSKVQFLKKANTMLLANRATWGEFLLEHPKGKKLPDYYVGLADSLTNEYSKLQDEAAKLIEKIELIKHVVDVQQHHAKGGRTKEPTSLQELIESVLVLQQQSILQHDIRIVKSYQSGTPVMAQRTQLVHIFLNLVKNAIEAMADAPEKRLTIEIADDPTGGVILTISDTGSGIAPENLERIFSHGFTTKRKGHGFGLHYCANALRVMGARVAASSDGKNKGATFSIGFVAVEAMIAA